MNESEIRLNALSAFKFSFSDDYQLIDGLLWSYVGVFIVGGFILNLLVFKIILFGKKYVGKSIKKIYKG